MAAKYGVSSQNISRTDVLCEGPVRGLKNGEASIFFNDVASEDANLRGYNPIEGTSSGKLTFDGSSATNTGITGATIPIDLDLGDRRPRPLELKNYKSTNVTLSSVTGSNGTGSVTCAASSGTPFTDDAWDTQGTTLRTAYLKREGVLLKGEFFKTSTSAGTFVFNGVTDVIDTTETHELRISYRFFIQSITNSSTLTLKSVPAAGTYFFEIPPLQLAAGNAAARNRYRASKITGIQAEFRPGHRYQDPLNEIGGVGGAVAATQSVNHELKVIGTGELTGINPVPEDGTIGSTMESGLPDDSQDDVATDAVILNDTAFGITAAQRPEVDEISLRITYPGGLQSMNNNKGRRDPAYARYLIQIQTTLDNVDSAWENAFPREGAYVEHTGRTNAAYSFDHVLGVNQYRPFDSFKVRVIRLTRHIGLRVNSTGHGDGVTDKEKWTLIAKSKIDQLGYVIKDRLSYPYTSVISTSFSSKQYQEPPKMSYLMQGLKVKVPSTYTPREYSTQTDSNGNPVAVYEEFWDGTFKSELQYTDNPAWVFYDIVTNNRYGAGKWIQESDIDKYSLYRIARYCDELVDNGAGGTEPRFRANIFLTKATDVYKVLKDFASTFTGMLYWMDGQLTPVQDSPADPVYNFTKGNVIDGKFAYESTGLKTRSNQVIVSWNDPQANYEPVPLIVEDREAIVRDKRIITEEVVAFGCTSEAQAIRYGRWKLWTAQKQTEIVSFKSALNSLYIKPGDIINVQDADREGVQYSGRVASATSTAIVLDRSVTLNAGSTYTVSTLVTDASAFYVGEDDVTVNSITYSRGDRIPQAYVYSGGSYSLVDLNTEERASNAFEDSSGSNLLPIVWKEYSYVQEDAVTTSSGTTNTIDVSSFGVTPAANTIWALKETKDSLNVVGSYKQYKVLSIGQDKSNEYSFSAVEHYDEKYGAVDNGYETGVIPTTIYQEAEPTDGEEEMSSPSNLRVVLETDSSRPGEEIRLEWDPSTSDFVDAYEVRHNIQDLDNPFRVSDTLLRLNNLSDDTYTFEVRAVSTKGNFSPYITLSYTSLDPYDANIDRVQYGIPKGAISNSEAGITGDAGSESFTFAKSSLALASNGDKETVVNPDENSQSIADITAEENYYIFLDADTPTLKLMYYDTESLENMPFWRDVGTGNSASSTSWTSIGTVSVSADSNRVSGSGFNTNVELRDILNLSGSTSPVTDLSGNVIGEGAVVIGIVSDTELIIDRTFDTAISSTTAYRANYRPDYEEDAAIARVHKDSSNVFTTERFLTVDPNFGSTPRSLLVNVDPIFLTYDIQGTQTNTPSSIDAEVYALGFTDPEFKMELPNRTNPVADNELDGTEVDFTSGETADLFRKDFTLDTSGTVEYAASDLSAVFTVREKNNTDLTATRTVNIPRRRDAASVFLELNNDNVTVFANTTDGAATVNVNCTATVSRGNNLFDIIAPDNVFTITTSETSGITGSLSGATYTVTSLAQNFTSGSVTFTATGVSGTEFDGVTLTKVMSISISSTSGIDAEVYQINSSVGSVSYNPNTTTFVPATSTGVTFSAQKIVGNDAPISFSSGYWRIFKNGSSTATYSSSSAESSVNFTNYSATDTLITAKLYLESAASTLLDSETVPIVLSGEDGVSYTGTQEYYKLTNSATAPSRYSSGTTIDTGWSTSPQTPTSTNQYLWNFNRNSKSDSTFDDSPVSLITQFVEDGVGIDSIAEAYQRSTSATTAPTGTWSSTLSGAGTLTESIPYLWNRTTITYTDSTTQVIYRLIAVKGDTGLDGASINLVFTRSSSTPEATGTGSLPTGTGVTWSDDPPSGTDPLWAVKGELNTSNNQWSWGDPYRVDGNAVAEVYFYSNATTGSAPSFTAPTYDFTNNSYTAPTNWNASPPSLTADGQKIWVIVVLYASTPGDTAATADTTSTAAIYAQRTDGADGDINKTVKLYQKGSTPPTDPTNGTGFNTTTGLAVAVGSWAVNPPTPTTTENVYVSEAVVTQTNATGSYSMTQDWVTSVHAAKQGADGDSGFFFFTRTGTGTGTGTAGVDLGPPSSSELASATAGQIAIVQNANGVQQGWRYNGSSWVAQKIVNQEIIFANAIGAEQLLISNTAEASAGIYMNYNGGNPKITIHDGTNLRVKIGYLA